MVRRATALLWSIALVLPVSAAEPDNPYDDPPPRRATDGIAACAAPVARRLTPEAARREAHQRVERGTSCWLEGKCEPGGDYRHDAQITIDVADAIARDGRFAGTSLWVETLRGFVTVKGCLADAAQGAAVEALVAARPRVKKVWQEAKVR